MGTQYTPDTFRGFDQGFVDDILTLMLTDLKFMKEYNNQLHAELFGDGIRVALADMAKRFYEQTGLVARRNFLTYVQDVAEEEHLQEAKVKLIKEHASMLVKSEANAIYVSQKLDKFFAFAKAKRLRHELNTAIEAGDVEAALQAVQTAQIVKKNDDAIPVDYFDTLDKRMIRRIMEQNAEEGVRFMIPTLEKYGIFAHRKEITLCIAPSKRGKSVFLSHAGVCAITQGHNTLHVSLENPLHMVENRYDAMLSQLDINSLESQMDLLGDRINYIRELARSKLYILWRMARTYSPYDLRADIQELRRQGKRIDVVLIDYGELMKSSVRSGDGWMRASRDEIFATLRAIASDEDFVCITAQQTPLKRRKQFRIYMEDGQESSMPAQHSSLILTLNQTEDEMAANEMRLYVDGYWHGAYGSKIGDILLKQDLQRMQFCLREMRLTDGVSASQQQVNP